MHLHVRQLQCVCARRISAELRGHAGHLRQRVQQHLRRQPLHEIARIVFRVHLVGRVGIGGKLVDARIHNRAGQPLHVVAALHEIVAQRGEQLFVRSRIGRPHIVHRFHQAPAHEIRPHPVHQRAREIGILGAHQPVGEMHAPVLGRIEGHGRTIQRRGRQRLQQLRMQHVAGGLGIHHDVARLVAVLQPHPREQVHQFVILLLRPLLQRMIMAARARHAIAHERLGRGLRQVDGILVQHVVIQRAVLPRIARRREDFIRELVPRLVILHAVANPVVERPHRVGAQLAAGD